MKIEIYIPDSLDEITLGQYQKFLSIAQDKEQDLFIQQKMVEIFCRLNLKDIANIKYTSLVEIIEHFNSLFSKEQKLIQSFKMDGLEFGFVPKLDDITFGEYVTLDTYLSDWKNIDKAMEVLYRPITNKHKSSYNVESYQDGKYDMRNMPLSAALGSIVFFLQFRQRIIENYPELFSQTSEQDYSRTASFGRKWGWYQSIFAIAQGSLKDFEFVETTNVHKCLMYLAFMKEKNEIESDKIKSKLRK